MSLLSFKNGDKVILMNKYKYRQLINSIVISNEISDDMKIEKLIKVIDSILDQYLN